MAKLLSTESLVVEIGSGNLEFRIQVFYAYIWHLDFAQNLKKAKKTKEISLWGREVKKFMCLEKKSHSIEEEAWQTNNNTVEMSFYSLYSF